MNQPHSPTLHPDDTGSAGTELTDDRTPPGDDQSAASDPAERATDDRAATGADVPEDHPVVADPAAVDDETLDPETHGWRSKRRHFVTYIVLPLLVMGMAVGAGYLKYQVSSLRDAQTAARSSVQAATDGTVALLSYNPDTVQTTLTAARDRLTGPFRDSYTSLTNDVVIPGAQQKKISATATVAAASSVSANKNHAVVLVFVDQSVIVGTDVPSATDSAVQVTLDKSGDRWLISGFDPK